MEFLHIGRTNRQRPARLLDATKTERRAGRRCKGGVGGHLSFVKSDTIIMITITIPAYIQIWPSTATNISPSLPSRRNLFFSFTIL